MRQTPFFLLLVSVTGFITDGDDVVDDDDDQHCLGSVRSGRCILRFVLWLLRLFYLEAFICPNHLNSGAAFMYLAQRVKYQECHTIAKIY